MFIKILKTIPNYPFITKSKLQKFMNTEEHNLSSDFQLILRGLCVDATETPQHIYGLLTKCEMINKHTKLILSLEILHDILKYESNPLSLLSNFYFELPSQFASMLIYLCQQPNINIDSIIESGLMQNFFTLNCQNMENVREVYQLLLETKDEFHSATEKIQSLINSAASLRSNIRTLESYSLNGQISGRYLYMDLSYSEISEIHLHSYVLTQDQRLIYLLELQKPILIQIKDLDPIYRLRSKIDATGKIYLTYEEILNLFNRKTPPPFDVAEVRPIPFDCHFRSENLSNLSMFFGAKFLIKILSAEKASTKESAPLIEEIIHNLPYSMLLDTYKQIRYQPNADTLYKKMGQSLSTRQINYLFNTNFAWIVLTCNPLAVDIMTKDNLGHLIAKPLNIYNYKYVIIPPHDMFVPYRDIIYRQLFDFLIIDPSRHITYGEDSSSEDENEIEKYFLHLKFYENTNEWCVLEARQLKQRCIDLIEEPFTKSRVDELMTIFTGPKHALLKQLSTQPLKLPRSKFQFLFFVLNELFKKNHHFDLLSCVDIFYSETVYSEEELYHKKIRFLYNCLLECLDQSKDRLYSHHLDNFMEYIVSVFENQLNIQDWLFIFPRAMELINKIFTKVNTPFYSDESEYSAEHKLFLKYFKSELTKDQINSKLIALNHHIKQTGVTFLQYLLNKNQLEGLKLGLDLYNSETLFNAIIELNPETQQNILHNNYHQKDVIQLILSKLLSTLRLGAVKTLGLHGDSLLHVCSFEVFNTIIDLLPLQDRALAMQLKNFERRTPLQVQKFTIQQFHTILMMIPEDQRLQVLEFLNLDLYFWGAKNYPSILKSLCNDFTANESNDAITEVAGVTYSSLREKFNEPMVTSCYQNFFNHLVNLKSLFELLNESDYLELTTTEGIGNLLLCNNPKQFFEMIKLVTPVIIKELSTAYQKEVILCLQENIQQFIKCFFNKAYLEGIVEKPQSIASQENELHFENLLMVLSCLPPNERIILLKKMNYFGVSLFKLIFHSFLKENVEKLWPSYISFYSWPQLKIFDSTFLNTCTASLEVLKTMFEDISSEVTHVIFTKNDNFLRNYGQHLKTLIDLFPSHVKYVCIGNATPILRQAFDSSLVGKLVKANYFYHMKNLDKNIQYIKKSKKQEIYIKLLHEIRIKEIVLIENGEIDDLDAFVKFCMQQIDEARTSLKKLDIVEDISKDCLVAVGSLAVTRRLDVTLGAVMGRRLYGWFTHKSEEVENLETSFLSLKST